MSKEYKNYIDLHHHSTGDERRLEMLSDILESGTFLPKTVEYKDIDEDFIRWVNEELKITSDDGVEFPTMVLISNQRFSEYTQSWEFTDSNKNLLLNFKSVTRDNNPQYGQIQGGYWNIPGADRFYLMKRQLVLDDNGSESFLDLRMKQPMAVDLIYRLSIFTTQYHSINDFNTMVNKAFSSRQCYIKPNGHFMPMTLDGISDESSYNINDRQFYGQTYNIKVNAYVITEDDYRVEEVPYKHGATLPLLSMSRKTPDVEIEECDGTDDRAIITIYYPEKGTNMVAEFTMDTNMIVNKIDVENIYNNYEIMVNGEIRDKSNKIQLLDGDNVKIKVNKQNKREESKIVLFGKINIFSKNI